MFITDEEIRALSSYEEVRDLSPEMLNHYINRADSWIIRATGRDYSLSKDRFIQMSLKQATLLLVEYLVYWDMPEIKESMMGPESGVTLGSYQVNYKSLSEWKQAVPGEETGIKELDNILNSLRYQPKAGAFFKVLGK